MKKRFLAILMVAILLIVMPMSVFAASNPYKDVKKSTVGKDAYNAIVYVKAHGA